MYIERKKSAARRVRAAPEEALESNNSKTRGYIQGLFSIRAICSLPEIMGLLRARALAGRDVGQGDSMSATRVLFSLPQPRGAIDRSSFPSGQRVCSLVLWTKEVDRERPRAPVTLF